LLFVAAVTLRFGGDGFAKRNRRRVSIQLDFVLGGHLLEDRLQVHLA
jgi:hypothetical protein